MELDTDTFVKLVAAAIPGSPEPHRTAESLAEEFGVTPQRIRRTVARLKDDHPDLPLTSGERGYRWSRDPGDVMRNAQRETRYVRTRTRRSLLDGLLAPYQKANPELAARTRQRIEFALEDLERATTLDPAITLT